jgi:hypothetical protein
MLCTSNGRGSAGYAANQSALLAWVGGLIVISILGRRSLLVPMCQWRFPLFDFRFAHDAIMGFDGGKRASCVGASRMLSHATAQRIWESHDAHAALLSPTTRQTLCKKFSLRPTPPSQQSSHSLVVPFLPRSACQGDWATIALSCRRPRCRAQPWSIHGMGLRQERWLAYRDNFRTGWTGLYCTTTLVATGSVPRVPEVRAGAV